MTHPMVSESTAPLPMVVPTWRGLALRGLLTVLFGVALFGWPGLTLTALVILFGAFALVEGALAVADAFGSGRTGWASALAGALGLVVGAIAMLAPSVTLWALVALFAAWAIVTGVAELAVAWRLRYAQAGSWTLALTGVLSIAIGGLVAWAPQPGLLALSWSIGAFAVAAGTLYLVLAWRLRGLQRSHGQPSAEADDDESALADAQAAEQSEPAGSAR